MYTRTRVHVGAICVYTQCAMHCRAQCTFQKRAIPHTSMLHMRCTQGIEGCTLPVLLFIGHFLP